MNLKITPLFSIFILYCFTLAISQADTLDSIIVTESTEIPYQSGDVISEENTSYSSSISLEKLQQPGLTLAQIINNESATQVQSSGGFGSYSDISLRGTTSEQVMIYLDGILLSSGAGGVDLSSIDLSQVLRVNLYKGSSPLQLGKSSFGGAVNIITHRSDKPLHSAFNLQTGSLNTHKFNAQLSGYYHQFDGLISFSHAKSDNDFEFINDNQTNYNTDDDRTEKRRNAQALKNSLLMKAGWQFNEHLKSDTTLQWSEKDQGIPDKNNSPSSSATLESKTLQLRSKLTKYRFLSNTSNATAEFYLSENNETFDDQNNQIGLSAQLDNNTDKVQGIKVYLEKISETSSQGISLDYHQEHYRQVDLLGHLATLKNQRSSLSMILQHNQFLDQERWLISPKITVEQSTNKHHLQEPDQIEKQTDVHTTAQLGIKHLTSDQLTLFANAGSYIREPSFFELFGDRGLFIANDQLTPEKGINIDVGMELKYKPKIRYIQSSRFRLGAWYNEIEDMIARVYDARGIGKSKNIASARLTGIEAETSFSLNNGLKINTNLTLQNPENRSNNSSFNNKVLPGKAKNSFFLSLKYPIKKGSFGITYENQSLRFYDAANLLPAKNKNLINLQFNKSINKSLSMAIAVNNIQNNSYEDFNGYIKPGRTWMISLNYQQ